jgi:hypothetical protein
VYWGYSLLLKIQFTHRSYCDYGLPVGSIGGSGGGVHACQKINDVTHALSLPRNVNETPWIDVGILFAMLFAFRYAIYLVLVRKTRRV